MGQLAFRLLLGFLAGAASWAIWEPMYPRQTGLVLENPVELYMILTAGALIGGAVGGYSGYLKGGRRHTQIGLGLGLLFGVIGISIGYRVGGGMANAMFGPAWWTGSFPAVAVPRLVAVAPAAALLGLAVGLSTLNPVRAVQGLIGGTLAGIASGLTFDLVGGAVGGLLLAMQGVQEGETGMLSRGLYFSLVGGLVALFIGIVERAARSAWLRLSLGRNEGKEWAIDAPQCLIGRAENASIPLFGDPAIAPHHAVVVRQGHQYFLADNQSGAPTFLNGVPVPPGQMAPLSHGAHIQVGNTVLQFLLKGQAVPARGPEVRPVAYPVGGPAQASGPAPAPSGYVPGQLYGNGAAAPQPTPAQAPTMAPTMMVPQSAVPSAPTLVALDGPLAGQRFPVIGPIELGRESTALPMAFDTTLSRRHALVSPGPGGLLVQDLGSTNGVYIDGVRVPGGTVGPGQTVRVGATTFRVE